MNRLIFPLIVVYGVLCAAAYSCLLPLWEGFDEAYHYGYVQYLSTRLSLPELGKAELSREIWHAYELVAVSHYVQPFTGAPVNFSDHFAMTQKLRDERRRSAESISADEKYKARHGKQNYEVNQAILPYLYMAAMDWVLVDDSIFARVLTLRLACSILAVLLIAHAVRLLASQLGLPPLYCCGALFCVFSSQMFYATICHVCNDWLAIPLMAYLVYAAVRATEGGGRRDYLLLGIVFAASILVKAYFLFLAPLAFGAAGWGIWKKRVGFVNLLWFLIPMIVLAGPWYARNLVLYHSFSGAVVQTAGAGPSAMLHSALALPWIESIKYMALSSLWTGNNSFTTFSSRTLYALLILLAAGIAMYARRSKPTVAEICLISAIVLFCCTLAVITVSFHVSSKGAVWAAVPWYMQTLLAPVLLVVFSGYARAVRWGKWLASATVALWGYVLAATFLVKLIPQYGGFVSQRPRLADLWRWYFEQGDTRDAMLRTLSLSSPSVLWCFTCAALILGLALALWLVALLSRPNSRGKDREYQP